MEENNIYDKICEYIYNYDCFLFKNIYSFIFKFIFLLYLINIQNISVKKDMIMIVFKFSILNLTKFKIR